MEGAADRAGAGEPLGAPAGGAAQASSRLMRKRPCIAAPVWLCPAQT